MLCPPPQGWWSPPALSVPHCECWGSHPGRGGCLCPVSQQGDPVPGTLHMGKPQAAFSKLPYVSRRIRDLAVNNLHQLCQITYLTKHSHFKLHCIKSPNAELQLEWPLALSPSNWHACFHKSYPGIFLDLKMKLPGCILTPKNWEHTSCHGSGWGSVGSAFLYSNPHLSPCNVFQCPDSCSVCVPVLDSSI